MGISNEENHKKIMELMENHDNHDNSPSMVILTTHPEKTKTLKYQKIKKCQILK